MVQSKGCYSIKYMYIIHHKIFYTKTTQHWCCVGDTPYLRMLCVCNQKGSWVKATVMFKGNIKKDNAHCSYCLYIATVSMSGMVPLHTSPACALLTTIWLPYGGNRMLNYPGLIHHCSPYVVTTAAMKQHKVIFVMVAQRYGMTGLGQGLEIINPFQPTKC